MSIPFPNPLEELSDDELYATALVLHLACGKAKSVLRQKHRTYLCALIGPLQHEAINRGKPSPTPPYRA